MTPSGIPKDYVQTREGEWTHPSRVGGLSPAKPKQDPLPALDQSKAASARRRSRVAVRITLIRCSTRLLDGDNLVACYKGLRDSIAATLKIDDNDKRVRWEYGQVECVGSSGTIVKFTLL